MRVGFIGLGLMGSGMTNNLQKAGHQLVLHDLRREAAEAAAGRVLAYPWMRHASPVRAASGEGGLARESGFCYPESALPGVASRRSSDRSGAGQEPWSRSIEAVRAKRPLPETTVTRLFALWSFDLHRTWSPTVP